jgi:flagellar protein FlaG
MTIDSIGSAALRPERSAAPVSDTAPAASSARAPATALETANAVTGAGAAHTADQVDEAVAQLNQAAQAKSQGVEFSVDKDTKMTVVKVVDQETKEVLRQMPTPEALRIAKALDASSKGMLIQQTA